MGILCLIFGHKYVLEYEEKLYIYDFTIITKKHYICQRCGKRLVIQEKHF